jgi:hypothetical protein
VRGAAFNPLNMSNQQLNHLETYKKPPEGRSNMIVVVLLVVRRVIEDQ